LISSFASAASSGAGKCDILHQLDIDAAGAEQHHWSHLGVERGADHEFKVGLDRCAIRDASSFGFALELLDPIGDVVEGFLDVGCAVDVEHHAADVGFHAGYPR
jgi:hypothetical protein